ncbi:uncharacterized protein NMK_1649 [Novimethylophilus kurashikiensis]|uniref:Lipoprotein n=1 Tax=Novimethylophilus kurashikiensis TaxID=1825523 RepID=A0A2R5F8E9_9PROT|nr:hypothetical protein [Novimethylophilus kurashikiensis]GBG14089.1 uncharacterized protein NMK_1649 [Novimethylophilus kurashikiensis]
MTLKRLSLALGVAWLSACATTGTTENPTKEARQGWIDAIYTTNDLPQPLPPCLANISPSEIAAGRIVEVSYWSSRKVIYKLAELPPSMTASLHQAVEIWPESCAAGKLSRLAEVRTVSHSQSQN